MRPGVGLGDAWGTVVGSDCDEPASGAPAGSLRAVPWITWASGASPFIAATAWAGTPARAAIPLSVSPGWTV